MSEKDENIVNEEFIEESTEETVKSSEKKNQNAGISFIPIQVTKTS